MVTVGESTQDIVGLSGSIEDMEQAQADLTSLFDDTRYNDDHPITVERHNDGSATLTIYDENGNAISSVEVTKDEMMVLDSYYGAGDNTITRAEYDTGTAKASNQSRFLASIMAMISDAIGKLGDAIMAAAK